MNSQPQAAGGHYTLQEDRLTELAGLLVGARLALSTDVGRADAMLHRAAGLLQPNPIGPGVPSRAGGLAAWRSRKVSAHVEAHLCERMDTAELAFVAGLSASHFARAFKASFGMPPHAYVVERRLNQAREFMLATQTPLSEIALACGLADQAHFSRLFRRRFGTTPAAWRRIHQEAPGRSDA